MTLILRGDSMLSGFATTFDIPANCLASHTILSAEPLTSIACEMRIIFPDTLSMALPGHTTEDVLQWFDLTEDWWYHPTIFWFGRCDKPVNPSVVVDTLSRMVSKLNNEWWILPIPVTQKEIESDRAEPIEQANLIISQFAGLHYLSPLEELYQSSLLPLSRRIDKFHPNNLGCKEIASWLFNRISKEI